MYSIMRNPKFIPFVFASFLISSISITFCNANKIKTASEVDNETPFTYAEGAEKGPKEWGHVNSTWKVCDSGKLQSPIDLASKRVQVFPGLGKLKKSYKPALAQIINRGHDIQVKWNGDAGKININGTDYKLQQCHWHSPSEHTINGKRFNMEMHVVHSNSKGGIAVIGILFKFGRADPFLSKLIGHLKTVGEKGEDLGVVNPSEIKFGSRKYYRYIGSLTVPPCTEGVTWTVLKKIRTVSREQVRALRDAVHDGFEDNARPVQDVDGRQVNLYNARDN
ncbi:hypothetical protein LguiB_004301 [Lonicera macranthoides]